jgi:transcriptional regulator with XRE-family HTH domain
MTRTTTTTTAASVSPLRRLRLLRNLTQERLAALSGLSRGWIGFLERTPECMTETASGRLARVLGCSPEELMNEGGR